jgi:hypothetical protein
MPAKKHRIADAERAKRIRETAREIGTGWTAYLSETYFMKRMERT